MTLNQWGGTGASPHQQPGLESPRGRQWLEKEKSFPKGIPHIHGPTQSRELPCPLGKAENPKSGPTSRLSLSPHSTTGTRERKILQGAGSQLFFGMDLTLLRIQQQLPFPALITGMHRLNHAPDSICFQGHEEHTDCREELEMERLPGVTQGQVLPGTREDTEHLDRHHRTTQKCTKLKHQMMELLSLQPLQGWLPQYTWESERNSGV